VEQNFKHLSVIFIPQPLIRLILCTAEILVIIHIVLTERSESEKPLNVLVSSFLMYYLFFHKIFCFLFPFYLQFVPVHSANCVKDVYSGM
jgi:hypothetical protein